MPFPHRNFWNLTGAYAAVFIPSAVVGALLGVFVLGWEWGTAGGVLAVFIAVGLIAAAGAARLASLRLSRPVDAVRDVLQQASVGDYADRVPAESRYLIEPLAETVDRMQDYLRERFAELQTSRDQLRTVLNSMVEGVIAVDSAQRVILVNDSACRLFRMQESAAVGRPLYEVVRNPQLQQWVGEALSQTEDVGGELELLAPASRTLSVRVAGLPANAAPGAVVVASDISQLRRLERVRQEFVANASHELKTPLASIKACVETLMDGAMEDEEIRVRFLQTMNEQSDRLDRLVRDLLALTRIESEGMKTDVHPVPLAESVAVCVERHRQNAKRKQMRIVVEAPVDAVMVSGDEESLEQILDNLIDNAIKYTNDGGTVTIRWRADEGHGLLEVEDTGIGIPQSHLTRIFERFYRVDKARSRELGGTGLGLSIVKHLSQALGGTVAVSSRLGKGTIFTIQLPLSGQAHAVPQTAS